MSEENRAIYDIRPSDEDNELIIHSKIRFFKTSLKYYRDNPGKIPVLLKRQEPASKIYPFVFYADFGSDVVPVKLNGFRG